VTAGTIAQELPPGFQRSEFLFEHGFIDRVVHRSSSGRRSTASCTSSSRAPSLSVAVEEAEVIGLPNFRPFSFLSNLAERVLPASRRGAGRRRRRTATGRGPALDDAVARASPPRPVRRVEARRG
jgi:hypothetical protein